MQQRPRLTGDLQSPLLAFGARAVQTHQSWNSVTTLQQRCWLLIRFQTPDKHVISVTQPVPHIQKAWKSLKLSAFPGAPLLVAQEQSEYEQLILVLFFHAEVLRACCFVLAFSCCFLNSNIFKIRTLWKPYPFPQSTLILYASKSVNIESWSD